MSEVRCTHCGAVAQGEPGTPLPPGWRIEQGFDFTDPARRYFRVYLCSRICTITLAIVTAERLSAERRDGETLMFPGAA